MQSILLNNWSYYLPGLGRFCLEASELSGSTVKSSKVNKTQDSLIPTYDALQSTLKLSLDSLFSIEFSSF